MTASLHLFYGYNHRAKVSAIARAVKPLGHRPVWIDDHRRALDPDGGYAHEAYDRIPGLLAARVAKNRARVAVIEMPELALHPADQLLLADTLLRASVSMTRLGQPRSLFLATHSEHIALRVLRRIRQTSGTGNAPAHVSTTDVAFWWVDGSAVTQIAVTEDGWGSPWPGGFFSERMTELAGLERT